MHTINTYFTWNSFRLVLFRLLAVPILFFLLAFLIILLVIDLRAPLLDATTEPCPPSLRSNLPISPHYQRQLLSPSVRFSTYLFSRCYFRSDFEKMKDKCVSSPCFFFSLVYV